MKYSHSWALPVRLQTRPVKIGDLSMGYGYPVVVQSMTTADTMDTIATVQESIRMIEAGCELIRITAPSKKEALNLKNIHSELRKQGYHTPLVADIHFTPNAAELAAEIVEKVRINPGNYADKKKFELLSYTPDAYEKELRRIEAKLQPLLSLLQKHHKALRIGVNHGSLSDRIMSFYGDNPKGMVESALEFIHFCEKAGFYSIVLSMKASNPQVMVYAYRLLVHQMLEGRTRYLYPLHLGVTEAGDGADGRIKSTIGIGTLLADGLGDTIRVSLTEPPEAEIPVAKAILHHYQQQSKDLERWMALFPQYRTRYSQALPPYNPFEFQRRTTHKVHIIGGAEVPRVMADFERLPLTDHKALQVIGYHYDEATDKWNAEENAADFLFVGEQDVPFACPSTLSIVQSAAKWLQNPVRSVYPLFESYAAFQRALFRSDLLNFVKVSVEEILFQDFYPTDWHNVVVVLQSSTFAVQPIRLAIARWMEHGIRVPVVLETWVAEERYEGAGEEEYFQVSAAGRLGPLLIDGLLDGLFIRTANIELSPRLLNQTAFNILQASRLRMSKTEYIACPSCGRTLFDLQATTAMVRKHTEHLKGLKIAIMGCIVNGPGEMADADYGYVGSGHGTVSLYKGKELLVRDIPSEQAVQELIALIKRDGKWIEPVLNRV